MWTLLLNRYVLGGLAIAALIGFLAYQKHGYDNRLRAEGAAPYIAAIEKQKVEAQALLDSEIAKNTALSKQWAEYARKADDDYAKQIADIARARNAADGVRFYDPGRRQGGSCPPAGTKDAGVSKDPASASELSPELTTFLKSEATRADTAATYAVKARADAIECFSRSIRQSLRGTP